MIKYQLVEQRQFPPEMVGKDSAWVKEQFTVGNYHQTCGRHRKGLVIEDGNARQNQGKEQELNAGAQK
jgi:hypothetical protein